MAERETGVAVVGGGPAGAATALLLARAGHEVTLFERSPQPRWRACGVYTSPDSRARLARLGLSAAGLAALLRPIAAMTVETTDGARCRLDYRSDGGAAGVDRPALDRALLDLAHNAGVGVRQQTTVTGVEPDRDRPVLIARPPDGGPVRWRARLIVGADGPGSIVARAFGVARPVRWLRRAGITVHRSDPAALAPGVPMDARMVIGHGWYCGVAPVPRDRVNIGIVLTEGALRSALARGARPSTLVDQVIRDLPGDPEPWQSAGATDPVAVALPLAHRVARRAGPGFLLVGDAAGFIDPISGEGLHRALVSAELAATQGGGWLDGDRDALARYDHEAARRFRGKDLVSWVLQAFIAQPRLLGYAVRRLESRTRERRTFGRVLADLEPPTNALDPRFLAALLRP
jgi:flavin-dependent dehydrogenase